MLEYRIRIENSDFYLLVMKISLQIHKRRKPPSHLSLLLFIILSFIIFLILSFIPKEKAPIEEKKDNPQPKISNAPPPLKEEKEIIQKGKTLSDILSKHNFSPAEIHKLRQEVKSVYDLSKIKAGHKIKISTSLDGSLHSIDYDIDNEEYLHIQKQEETYKAKIEKIPYEIKTRLIWGIIEDNLVSALARENENVALAISLEDLFAWDIDFYADLRTGDSFKIIFEKKFLEGEFVAYRNILTAEFTNQGKTFQAFRYTYPDTGETDYFDLNGGSLRKEFLKSAIGSARITSRFSYSRLHPIRKVYRPHYGVDYAAQVGTPVQVTADGTVTFAGWNGASGRMVRVRHKNAYETMYLHLRRITVKKGAKVTSGDIIGQVGSSGESTGPHLDYRIKQRGKYINPLAVRFEPMKPLRTEYLEDFRKEAGKSLLYLDAPLILFSSFSHPMRPCSFFTESQTD